MQFDAVLLAGGSGQRFGGQDPKLFLDLEGMPILGHSLKRLQAHGRISRVVVTAHRELKARIKALFPPSAFGDFQVVEGGESRGHSVQKGLEALGSGEGVVIHDGARPLWTSLDLDALVDVAEKSGAALLTAPCNDTIKVVNTQGRVESTPDRDTLARALTPQAFHFKAIRQAYAKGLTADIGGTDCASFAESAGLEVYAVTGSPWNVKLTTPSDLPVIRRLYLEHQKELAQ